MTFVGRRVLVVEDEFLTALTTIDLLESMGCEVAGPIAHLAAALQLVQSQSFDAAVLDINIAGEMIWPVAEELRRRDVPCLFLSAYSEQTVIPAPFAAAPRLSKPLEPKRLLHHLVAIWNGPAGGAVPGRGP